ncbi:hypothetical protein AB833_15125 [Chromatiales bacterium (ex Bugula neritina AB1)]|nr:hypothetical protein AB833_15125 [Chromatiales bacterium (ex Bugula neritina AB1)]
MDPRLLEHYRRELQHLREMGGEFAAEHPNIAGRLGIETLKCTDPYVERLMESYAFLAARVQLKIDSSYSKTARSLMEMVYPDYLAPLPSMLIATFHPSMTEGSLVDGFKIGRGATLLTHVSQDVETACQFRTASDVTLWPIKIDSTRTLTSKAAIEAAGIAISSKSKIRSALALKLSTDQDLRFSELAIDELVFYITGADGTGAMLYEQLLAHTRTVALTSQQRELKSPAKPVSINNVGFSRDEALLPCGPRGFDGYRILQEYFAFPERFQFFSLKNLAGRLKHCDSTEVEIVFLFDNSFESDSELFGAENFVLNCAPAINLFPKTADRIHLDRGLHEFHVIPDRTRPKDFEIYRVEGVQGHGSDNTKQPFFPYFSIDSKRMDRGGAFYSIQREERVLSAREQRVGARSQYTGSEVFLSLVDIDDLPYRSELRQLTVKTLCTNRDLPLDLPKLGIGETDLTLETSAPEKEIRIVAGPTKPRPSRAHQRDAWQLISNLSLNYLSISDTGVEDDGKQAAAMLRQMLEVYSDNHSGSKTNDRLIEGILRVETKPIVRQRKVLAHVEVAYGLQVKVTIDESAFEGTGAYLFGSVLENFFASYASTNSFTETVLETLGRGEIGRWPVRIGSRRQL